MEQRDGSGSVAKQFFSRGELISGSAYFYSSDHLGSVRELTDFSGNKQAEYSYDPYGVKTTIVGNVAADFQFGGYYLHSRSGLSLTNTRANNSSLGRFINRDPIEELGGVNLYGYVANMPVEMTDPTGLDPDCRPNPCPKNFTGHKLVFELAASGLKIYVECINGKETGKGVASSGDGSSEPFNYNPGNGPYQQGAEAAEKVIDQQYRHKQWVALGIAAGVDAAMLVGEAAFAKGLADVDRILQTETKFGVDHTGGLDALEADYFSTVRKMLESLFYKG